MTNETRRNWRSLYPIWMKYCGVCDEYSSLKSKWTYIRSIRGLRALPEMQSTFNRMDQVINETNELFKPMFDRTVPDDITKFKHSEAELRMNELQDRFYSLTHYFGILKLILFQRTVSSEISEIISGLPTSPERTIGNEAIYLSADKVCKRYLSCLNIDPELHWDGAVSFVHPVQMDQWFGGLSWPDRYLKHFHVVISEENKHFLGTLIILAHELSHAAHVKFKPTGTRPNWFELMWRRIVALQVNEFSKRLEEIDIECKNCPNMNYIEALLTSSVHNSIEFRQFVADLLAFLIGGPMTIMSLIDLALNSSKTRYYPIRPAFVMGFCHQSNLKNSGSFIEKAILEMLEGWHEYLPIFVPNCPYQDNHPCIGLQLQIGERSDRMFAYNDARLLSELKSELPVETVNYPQGVNTITSGLVKERFSISEITEKEIMDKLSTMVCCPNEDPRHILHCYYKLLLKGINADYSTTLHSLAYNKYKQKREKE